MPTKTSYPGVYIEEVPSGVRTITGVSTSITAFIGYAKRGPVNKAVQVLDFGSFERSFGGLSADSDISYAVRQFFLNGGTEAWVVRVASGAAEASVTLMDEPAALKVLVAKAKSEGLWGNNLKLDVDYATTNPDSTFNLTVTEYVLQGTDLVPGRSEVHRNLSMNQSSSLFAPIVVSSASDLIDLARSADVTPAILGALPEGWSLGAEVVQADVLAGLGDTVRSIAVAVDGQGPFQVAILQPGDPIPADLDDLATLMETQIRAANPASASFSGLTVAQTDAAGTTSSTGGHFLITSGATGENSSVRVVNASSNNAAHLLGLGPANGGREHEAAADLRPAQSGTVSGDPADLDFTTLSGSEGIIVTVHDGTAAEPTATFTLGSVPTTLSALAQLMQSRLRSVATSPALKGATVQAIGTRLRVVAATPHSDATVEVADDAGTVVSLLLLDAASATSNVQRYSVGTGAAVGAQIDPLPGNDGAAPAPNDYTGSLAAKTGIYALEDVDLFNILCIPSTAFMAETDALAVTSEAAAYCGTKRAFFILDPPVAANQITEIQDWKSKLTPVANAALYFPFVRSSNPLQNNRLVGFPASGTLAGLFARTDAQRGVWKAPAGTEATLANVQSLQVSLSDPENGQLNPIGINCLRSFPVYGRVCWGARTLLGDDQQSSEWKYVPVRRFALFLEESLYRGSKWVVFEPNDEPLWAQVRLNIGAFLQGLFRQGAFQGATPREAYFVKCDKETTTQADINLGIVNILVGFAPLKPAEFVIIKIQQMAGQIPT